MDDILVQIVVKVARRSSNSELRFPTSLYMIVKRVFKNCIRESVGTILAYGLIHIHIPISFSEVCSTSLGLYKDLYLVTLVQN